MLVAPSALSRVSSNAADDRTAGELGMRFGPCEAAAAGGLGGGGIGSVVGEVIGTVADERWLVAAALDRIGPDTAPPPIRPDPIGPDPIGLDPIGFDPIGPDATDADGIAPDGSEGLSASDAP